MRQRLIAAARLLFARQGYEATTLQQVVTEAETSIGNCYFYFANKETLLLAVAEQFRCEVAQEIDAAITPLSPGPLLLAVAVYTGVLAVLRQPALARVALFETAHPVLRSAAVELFASRTSRILTEVPQGEGPSAHPILVAHAWQGAIQSTVEGVLTGRITDEPEIIARFLVSWNLRALGFSEEAVTATMRDALLPLNCFNKTLPTGLSTLAAKGVE
jgi:AcrR family transcriptional regulator